MLYICRFYGVGHLEVLWSTEGNKYINLYRCVHFCLEVRELGDFSVLSVLVVLSGPSLWIIIIIHSTKCSLSTRLYNICSCLFNNLTHCTVQMKGLKIQWTKIQSNQAFINFYNKTQKIHIHNTIHLVHYFYNIPL